MITYHPEDCPCETCGNHRAAYETHLQNLAKRQPTRIDKDDPGEMVEYRRGKRVVSKGCKNCHGKKGRKSVVTRVFVQP